MPGLTYAEAVSALSGALKFGVNPSLEGIQALCEVMDRPQDSFVSVQVTGTNGKSSVTRMTAAILRAHGVKAAAYTSPHLESYTERMEIGGKAVSEETFARALEAALNAAERAKTRRKRFTEFELITAAALWLFREEGVEVACLEVGMGGRWDATSVVEPKVAVVTGVALDHTDRLGETRREIAADKAHIIKRGSIAILGSGLRGVLDVFLQQAEGVEAPIARPEHHVRARPDRPDGEMRMDVTGIRVPFRDLVLHAPSYQAPNAACAVAAAQAALGVPLDEPSVRSALAGIRFPGRFEVVRKNPYVVLDGAHNPEAAGVLAEAVAESFRQGKPDIVLGILKDKDAEGIALALAPVGSRFIASAPESERALAASSLAKVLRGVLARPVPAEQELGVALQAALALPGTAGIVVTGSLYTVGQARKLLRGSDLRRRG